MGAIWLCVLGACDGGHELASVEDPISTSGAAVGLHVYVSNESAEFNPVDLTVKFDGQNVISDFFEHRAGQGWHSFTFDVDPGMHTVALESRRGKSAATHQLELPAERWILVSFRARKNGQPAEPEDRLVLTLHDQPIYGL